MDRVFKELPLVESDAFRLAPDALRKESAPEAQKPAGSEILVPALRAELPYIHARLAEIIATSPYYAPQFKTYESHRLSLRYLARLWAADPRHIMTIRDKGKLAGFMISGPELGTLWLYWSYVFPECRTPTLPMKAMRAFPDKWARDRFHKVVTYTKPGNDVAIKLMQRYGWKHVVTLTQHLFGEDFMLYELPLEKTLPGYDMGPGGGRFTGLVHATLARLGL